MRPSTRRLVGVAATIFLLSLVGAVLALAFQWPTQFDGSGRAEITLREFILQGTASSIPVGPWLLLGLFTVLARSRRWWGTVAVAGLTLLAPVLLLGSLGEAFAPENPFVSRTVLVTVGVIGSVLSVLLLLAGVADLIDRLRGRRRPAPAADPDLRR